MQCFGLPGLPGLTSHLDLIAALHHFGPESSKFDSNEESRGHITPIILLRQVCEVDILHLSPI
jgi:hypothetical protein